MLFSLPPASSYLQFNARALPSISSYLSAQPVPSPYASLSHQSTAQLYQSTSACSSTAQVLPFPHHVANLTFLLPERCNAPTTLKKVVSSQAYPPPLRLGHSSIMHHSPNQKAITTEESQVHCRVVQPSQGLEEAVGRSLSNPTEIQSRTAGCHNAAEEAHKEVQLLADKWLAAKQTTTRTNSRVQKFRASLKRRCLSDLQIKKKHERDSQLHHTEDVIKFAESEWAATGIARPLFRRASIVFGPPFKAPQTPAEHAKDRVISNAFADCDNKDLLGRRFDKTSLETLEGAEDEIIKQWLRPPVESIGDSTSTIFWLSYPIKGRASTIIKNTFPTYHRISG